MLPGSRKLIAGLLGVAPQSLSRAFYILRPIGISGGGREISIMSTARLREFAGARGLADAKDRHPGPAQRKPTRVASSQATRKTKRR